MHWGTLPQQEQCNGIPDRVNLSQGVGVNVVSKTGGQNNTVTSASRKMGTRSGPERTSSLVSITTVQPDTQALYISEILPSYPNEEVRDVASIPGRMIKIIRITQCQVHITRMGAFHSLGQARWFRWYKRLPPGVHSDHPASLAERAMMAHSQ